MPETAAEDDLREALEAARRGDRGALPALRRALDAHPEIWRQYGDLAAHAERAWVELIAGTDLALAESLARKAAALKAELAGPSPTPLERLLAERIAVTHLQLYYADASLPQAGEVSIKQADLAQKRQARCHRSYLMAIGMLATVRRLLPAAEVPADAPGRIAGRAGAGDPAAPLDVPGPAGPGDDERPCPPAGHSPPSLFVRDEASPKPSGGPGGDRRGRSAS